jgi:hypothetical protein
MRKVIIALLTAFLTGATLFAPGAQAAKPGVLWGNTGGDCGYGPTSYYGPPIGFTVVAKNERTSTIDAMVFINKGARNAVYWFNVVATPSGLGCLGGIEPTMVRTNAAGIGMGRLSTPFVSGTTGAFVLGYSHGFGSFPASDHVNLTPLGVSVPLGMSSLT